MATNTYVALDKVIVNGTSTNNITFTSIPSTYTDLFIVINSSKTSGSATNVYLRFNNDSNSNYSSTFMYGTGSSTGSSRTTSQIWTVIGDQTTDMSQITTQIMNYSNTTTKKTHISRYSNASEVVMAAIGLWQSTAAINQVDVYLTAGTYFSSGSTISLYGIKAWSDETTPKATGGYVYQDSTYWYHAFPFSSTFTPNQSLSCDLVLVAGGGGGGGDIGGGGGAGGFRNPSSIAVTAQNYTITIGAGGIGGPSSTNGTQGGNSSALTYSATGGGYGARYDLNGGSGGSGGGGGRRTGGGGSGNAGSYSPAEGYNGSAGTYYTSDGSGGGGGGSAAAATNSGPSNGGSGTSSVSSWLSAINFGIDISGTKYIAGGGGGGSGANGLSASGGNGGGGRGGASWSSITSTAGIVSTGSGGGGGSNANGTGSNGGSGLVIIRYAK